MEATSSHHTNLIPVFSREMTMEAHFTFTSPTANVPPAVDSRIKTSGLSSTATEGLKKDSQWHWAEGGAHCSVECGRSGLSMQYEAAPINLEKFSYNGVPRKLDSYSGSVSEKDSSPQLPPDGPRHHVARPYERRCKSTAQIVLKQVEEPSARPKSRASEFHGATDHESIRKQKQTEQSSYCGTCGNFASYKPPSCHQTLCSCLHCTTLHKLVRSLTHDCFGACPTHYTDLPSSISQPKSSVGLQSFNSHRRYQQPPNNVGENGEKHDSSSRRQREKTPMPASRSRTPSDRDTYKGPGLDQSDKKKDHSKRTRAKIHSRSKSRPKTIHIDVYCSTSSSSEGDSSDHLSEESEELLMTDRRSSRALLALGSKRSSKKSDFFLSSKEDQKNAYENAITKTGSFIYQSKNRRESPTVSAFMTDHPLSLRSSSPTLERPASSPPTVSVQKSSTQESYRNVIPLPFPVKPTTLPVSPLYTSGYPLTFPGKGKTSASHKRNGSWESGSVASIPSPNLDYLDPFFRQDHEVSSLFDDFVNLDVDKDQKERVESRLPWRSPKLERRKYLAKSQEERFKAMDNVDKRQSYRDLSYESPETPQNLLTSSQQSEIRTPTEVSELAKMSVFKDFSEEELQVISKSLTKRESERSQSSEKTVSRPLSRHGSSSTFPRSGGFHELNEGFARLQTELNSSQDSLQLLGTCDVTVPIKLKEDLRQLPKEGSHLFRKSFENTKLVKFVDPESNVKLKEQTCEPPSQLHPLTEKFDPKNSTKYMRPINVGLFRRINRFPFNPLPQSASHSRSSGVYSQLRVNNVRFLRPHIFGEALVRANRRQGIHFGPPRNPQCSCVNCLSYLRHDHNLLGCRLKSQSLSDLNPATSLDHSQE